MESEFIGEIMGKNIDFDELDEYMNILNGLSDKDEILDDMKEIVYEGAAVMADAIRDEIQGANVTDNPKNGMTRKDKEDLLDGFGVSPIQTTNDDANVKMGFSGYSKTNTWKGKSGKQEKIPIPVVARTCLSGTSWHKKDDFVGRAVRKSKEKSLQAMGDKFDNILEDKFKK